MRQLTEVAPRQTRHLSWTTLIVLSAATLVAPGLFVLQGIAGGVSQDAWVIAAAAGVVLVMAE